MGVFNKLTYITSFYRDINPSNLSGAIDVIAVKQKDSGSISATPFHIRFGKKHIFQVTNNHVTMFVNGEVCSIGIKLSKNGNVYFEREDSDSENSDLFENDKIIKTTKIWSPSELKAILRRKNILRLERIEYLENKELDNKKSLNYETLTSGSSYSTNSPLSFRTITSNKIIESTSDASSTISNFNFYDQEEISENEMIYKKYNLDFVDQKDSISEKYEYKESNSTAKKKNKKKEILFLKLLAKNFTDDELLNKRKINRSRRIPMLHREIDFYHSQKDKHTNFNGLLSSKNNLMFLLRSHKKLYTVIMGLISPHQYIDSTGRKSHIAKKEDIKKMNLPCNLENGCAKSEVSFSLCSKQKIYKKDIGEVFENFRSRSLENTKNLVAKIIGCEKCKSEFYIYYDLFTELFFYLRNLEFTDNKSKKRKFLEFLEKRCTEKSGYNFFAKEKWKTDLVDKQKMTIRLSQKQLERMNLKDGINHLLFKIDGTNQKIEANCYYWDDDSRIIVTDVDGTITKSDALGHVYTMVGRDWTHSGVAELFSRIRQNGYKIIYLSSRPIGQMEFTKKYLDGISQNGFEMPEGPVLVSPDGFLGALYREFFLRRPEDFKIACLQIVKSLFKSTSLRIISNIEREKNPLFGGFGNRKTDIITYKAVGIPSNKIYTINPHGVVVPELSFSLSNCYLSLNSIADKVFPPLNVSTYISTDLKERWWCNLD